MARDLHRAWALLFARLVLGLIFLVAGVWKVFQLGPVKHARKYFLPFSDTFLPIWSLWFVGVTIPWVELIAGALVILGLRLREALVALGFVLAIVTFGHLLREPLYNLTATSFPVSPYCCSSFGVQASTTVSPSTISWRDEKPSLRMGQMIRALRDPQPIWIS